MNLTREQIEQMPERELDQLIATQVMGARLRTASAWDEPYDFFERREDRSWEPLPGYSTGIAAAWEVVDKMRQLDEDNQLNAYWPNFWHNLQGSRIYELTASGAAVSICRAALIAILPKEPYPVVFDKLSNFFKEADFSHLQDE